MVTTLHLVLLTGSETMLFELEDEGSVYDVSICSDHITPDCHALDFVRPLRLGMIGGSDWA